MDYRNLPSNSHKSKEEQPREKKEKITTGKVTMKKKSLVRRILSGLIEDDAKSIGDYIVEDVLQPTLKNTILSIITGSAERIFGGSAKPNQTYYKKSNASYVNYSSMSKQKSETKPRSTSRYDFSDIIFENRGDAEDVKDAITALIEGQYKAATVADLYDLIGIEETEFTDNNYGWTNPKNFSVSFTNGGYRLNVPNPIPLR